MPPIDLPAPAGATVSIVVLAFRRVDVLDRCLRTLASHQSTHPFEVVVVSNGASPGVREFLGREVRGGKVVRSRVNLGFAGGCNLGVASSTGQLVVLLNDDAFVEPGWLDALVAAAEANPKAAVVGSLILFPDGTVQDAGGAIGPDHMPAVLGRGLPRTAPICEAPRKVDYASGAAVLLRRDAWEQVGGMDEGFYPAYFEDVDLCLRLREVGWETWIEPRAVVLHDESASSDPVLKALAWDWNKERYLARWGPHEGPPVDPVVVNGPTDLLEAEIRFLERAGQVYEERLARTDALLEEARFELGKLKVDQLATLDALERERAHSAWLAGLLEAERAHSAGLVEELAAVRASTLYRAAERARSAARSRRSLRAVITVVRRLRRR